MFWATVTALLGVLGHIAQGQDCVDKRITVYVNETAEEGYFVVLDDSGIFTGRSQYEWPWVAFQVQEVLNQFLRFIIFVFIDWFSVYIYLYVIIC